MSDLLSSISALFTGDQQGKLNHHAGPHGQNETLVTTASLLAGVKRCLSKFERDKYLSGHLKVVQNHFSNVNITNDYIALLLEHCLICNSFGHDASFAGIYAIQLAQSAQVWRHKLLAYTACNIIVDESSDTVILMVATLQRDILCSHVESILLALSAATHLMGVEFIPALDEIVSQRAAHPSFRVRRRAVACIGAFIQKMPELLDSKLSLIKVSELFHTRASTGALYMLHASIFICRRLLWIETQEQCK